VFAGGAYRPVITTSFKRELQEVAPEGERKETKEPKAAKEPKAKSEGA